MEMLNGREHIVVPVVALMEGVIHAVNANTPEFVPAATLAKAASSWNGRPVTLGHPTKNGRQCSANEPAILASHGLGTVFNSRFENKRLLCEAWIDKARVEALDSKMAARLLENEREEVSVGAMVVTDNVAGDHNGKSYKASWAEASGDHLAFLPGGRGACSIEMGCGAHRAASYLVTAEGIEEENPWRALLRALMPRGWGDDEVKQELREALAAVDPASRNGEILRVTNDRVVYCVYPPVPSYPTDVYATPPSMTYWSRDFTFDTATQKYTVSVDRMPVEPTTVYAPLRSAKAGYEDCAACKGSGNVGGNPCESCDGAGELKAACRCEHNTEEEMNKTERIAALAKNEHNPTKSLKALEALTDDELKALEAHCAKAAELKAASDKAAADLKAAEEARVKLEGELKAAQAAQIPAEELANLRTLAEEKKTQDAAEKASIVGKLKAAQSAFTEEELNAKALPELRKLASMANVVVPDFSGKGIPIPRSAGDKTTDFAPPDPWGEGLKALKASETVN